MTLRKANLITVGPWPRTQWKEDKKGSFSFRCGRKTPENCSRETHIIRWTKNPSTYSAPSWIQSIFSVVMSLMVIYKPHGNN